VERVEALVVAVVAEVGGKMNYKIQEAEYTDRKRQ
jgi:hypothetical protein